MQYPPTSSRPQLGLFDGLMSASFAPFATPLAPARDEDETDVLGELAVSGSSSRCQRLLIPILRELSDSTDSRWLTLVAPPSILGSRWLRDASLKRDRIIVLHPRDAAHARELACKALASGQSHTVITWLGELDAKARLGLRAAAVKGNAQNLNVRLDT
ncbi:SOS-induced cell division inhibitor SulA [Stutzerimonas urumqiensis]|uniref:SOS-induced cell division inhibitor SulA n=1 Tax=Stutzerimonas urumqiensis TaxID=638269 RepID=UPI000EB3E9F5|nr:SOS-induced cell division inhibitor SulA [Stutzerimonas urumqiensis]